jgi:WD40 repeat protein
MDTLRFPAKLLVSALLFAGTIFMFSVIPPAQMSDASDINVRLVTSATFDEAPKQVAWSQDGQAALIVSGDFVWWLPVEGDPSVLLQVTPEEEIVAISPSGIAAITADPFTINLVDAAAGNLSHTLALGAALTDAEFSPDGQTLATTSTTGMTAQLWDVLGGTLLDEVSTDLAETSDREIRFSSDVLLVWSSADSFQVVDIETGGISPIMRVEGPINDIAVNPLGAELAVASDVLLSFWDESSDEPLDSLRTIKGATSVSYAWDGSLVASASKRGVDILDMPLARPASFLDVPARDVEFARSGLLFITGEDSGKVSIWRID